MKLLALSCKLFFSGSLSALPSALIHALLLVGAAAAAAAAAAPARAHAHGLRTQGYKTRSGTGRREERERRQTRSLSPFQGIWKTHTLLKSLIAAPPPTQLLSTVKLITAAGQSGTRLQQHGRDPLSPGPSIPHSLHQHLVDICAVPAPLPPYATAVRRQTSVSVQWHACSSDATQGRGGGRGQGPKAGGRPRPGRRRAGCPCAVSVRAQTREVAKRGKGPLAAPGLEETRGKCVYTFSNCILKASERA